MAVEQYRQYIQDLLFERANRSAHATANSQTETQMIFDVECDHYQLVHGGWRRNGRRNYGCVLHLDIKLLFAPVAARPGQSNGRHPSPLG